MGNTHTVFVFSTNLLTSTLFNQKIQKPLVEAIVSVIPSVFGCCGDTRFNSFFILLLAIKTSSLYKIKIWIGDYNFVHYFTQTTNINNSRFIVIPCKILTMLMKLTKNLKDKPIETIKKKIGKRGSWGKIMHDEVHCFRVVEENFNFSTVS